MLIRSHLKHVGLTSPKMQSILINEVSTGTFYVVSNMLSDKRLSDCQSYQTHVICDFLSRAMVDWVTFRKPHFIHCHWPQSNLPLFASRFGNFLPGTFVLIKSDWWSFCWAVLAVDSIYSAADFKKSSIWIVRHEALMSICEPLFTIRGEDHYSRLRLCADEWDWLPQNDKLSDDKMGYVKIAAPRLYPQNMS